MRLQAFVAVWRQMGDVATSQPLLIEQIAPIETPGRSIVKIEVPISTEVLAGKELAIRLGNEPHQLLVAELVELLRRDGFTDSGFEGFHHGLGWFE